MRVRIKLKSVIYAYVFKEITPQCLKEGAQGKQGVSSQWNVLHEDGKNDGKCAGNGREKDWKKKSVRENSEEQEANNLLKWFFMVYVTDMQSII